MPALPRCPVVSSGLTRIATAVYPEGSPWSSRSLYGSAAVGACGSELPLAAMALAGTAASTQKNDAANRPRR
eukprot:scaffold48734_cov72-Phaeocystis_antarctica.AAC.5